MISSGNRVLYIAGYRPVQARLKTRRADDTNQSND